MLVQLSCWTLLSDIRPSLSNSCFLESGLWFPYPDGMVSQSPEAVHVDERLPLVVLVGEPDEAEEAGAALRGHWKRRSQ